MIFFNKPMGFVTRLCFCAWSLAGLLGAHAQTRGTSECGRMVTFADGKKPERVIYVAESGNDGPGEGRIDSPYRTIGRAVEAARPGTAIRVRPGDYQGGVSIADLAGTADAPIWIGGVEGEERPVIRGGSSGLHLTRVRYVVVHDLEVTGARVNGINCDDGGDYADPEATSHVIFRDLYIHDVGDQGNQDGLKLSGVDDFWVLRCEISRCGGGGSGIDHVGCHRGRVAGSFFHDLGSNAVQCKGGSEDIEIWGNRFVNAGQRAINLGGSTGFRYFRPPLDRAKANVEARNIRVIANTFVRGDAQVAFVGSVECLVANNTMIDPDRYVLRVLQETTSREGVEFLACGRSRFVNNLVYFRAEQLRGHVNVGGNTAPESFQFSNNLWYAHDAPGRSKPRLPVKESGAVVGMDPGFADPAGGDYRIRSSSPAARRGVFLPEVTADFGLLCYDKPPSIGAFERVRE